MTRGEGVKKSQNFEQVQYGVVVATTKLEMVSGCDRAIPAFTPPSQIVQGNIRNPPHFPQTVVTVKLCNKIKSVIRGCSQIM